MKQSIDSSSKISIWYTVIGSLLTIVVFIPSSPLQTNLIEKIVLLAILVPIPLSLPLLEEPKNSGQLPQIYQLMCYIYPVVALMAVSSHLPHFKSVRGWLSLGWLGFTIILALHGMYRYLRHGNERIEELAIDIASIYIVIGAIWYSASRFDLHFLGFTEPFVILTAIHFHYTAFLATILIGSIARIFPENMYTRLEDQYKMIIIMVLLATPLIAVGITFSPIIELLATLLLSTALYWYATLMITNMGEMDLKRLPKILLTISSMIPFWSMSLAVIYATSTYFNLNWIKIDKMLYLHGFFNAFGFVLIGLIAVRINNPDSRLDKTQIPFSAITIDEKMYATYIEDHDLVDTQRTAYGMVDTLTRYDSINFRSGEVNPEIVRFYERTGDYDLEIDARWKRGFGFLSRIYRKISQKTGQMNFLSDKENQSAVQLNNKILPISEEHDSRSEVLSWVRSYHTTSETLYAAIYHHYRFHEDTLMNIAFPLQNMQMTSIMRMEHLSTNGSQALQLTTFPKSVYHGHEGIYLVTKWLPIRLPFNETIKVWTPNMLPQNHDFGEIDDSIDLVAEHKIWLFGYNFLTLYYQMWRKDQSSD